MARNQSGEFQSCSAKINLLVDDGRVKSSNEKTSLNPGCFLIIYYYYFHEGRICSINRILCCLWVLF